MTLERPVLAQRICTRLLEHTAAVGHFGRGYEAQFGSRPKAILEFSPERLLTEVRRTLASRCALDALDNLAAGTQRRLAALFIDRMTELVRQHRVGRRPDALRLAAQLTANPDYPHSYAIARYCVALMLRNIYRIDYNADQVAKLRQAYERLAVRFGQKACRELKSSSAPDRYLLDILCLDEHIERSYSSPEAYWSAHASSPLGIGKDRRREYPARAAPQLKGKLPDFASLMNDLWAQPTGIEGLDEVLGGLLPAMPGAGEAAPGGLVTLVCGPPGSGKTTFCMTLACRMAEFGSTVRYVATEEPADSLRGRRDAAMEPRVGQVWPALVDENQTPDELVFVDGSSFERLDAIVATLRRELDPVETVTQAETDQLSIAPIFGRVVVIDSLTALMERTQSTDECIPTSESDLPTGRRRLAEHLEVLRNLGVCVFLVGGQEESYSDSLAYLVDNVLELGFEEEPTGRHPLRILFVSKTRYQASRRGRHVLHLSRRRGCTISPSLHAVLGIAKTRPWVAPDSGVQAKLSPSGPSLRRYSQTLIYGRGSAGKASLALALAMDPRSGDMSAAQERGEIAMSRVRVLIISFLYEEAYYEELGRTLLQKRFLTNKKGESQRLAECLDVMSLYPGYIDPETLVAKVRLRLARAQHEGRPFSAVLVDGVHNLLLQFPLLYPEPLIWPTLYRLFRGERMDVVTTFTFFRVGSLVDNGQRIRRPDYISAAAGAARLGASNVGASAELFFHMLVSSCDYTFLMEQPEAAAGRPAQRPELLFMTSMDGLPQVRRFSWDARSCKLSEPDPGERPPASG